MNIRKLSEGLYIAPQLSDADVQDAAALGIRSVICNRPDGEAEGQPSFEEMCNWFAAEGITHMVHQPVQAPSVGRAEAVQFEKLRQEAPTPVLAYCRTGTRSSLLWALYQVQNGMAVADAMAAAARAGVDLGNFEAKLREAAAGS